MFISAVKFHILTWGSMGIDSLLQPAPSGHSRNCSLWLFLIVLTAQHGSLPLGFNILQTVKVGFNILQTVKVGFNIL